MCTSAGLWIFGSRTPARPGPATARRSFSVCPVDGGCTRANTQRQLARHQRVEELAGHLAAALALRLRDTASAAPRGRRPSSRRRTPRVAAERVGVVAGREHDRPQRTGVVAVHNHTSPASASAWRRRTPRTPCPRRTGVRPGVEAHRVHEREVAEVALGDHAVLDQLERLGDRLGHVAHVPVRDVGAEDRAQPRAERVHVVAERPRHERVVGLAPEVEVGLEPGAQVLGRLDADGRELVDLRRAGRRAGEVLAQLAHARRHLVVAVLGEVCRAARRRRAGRDRARRSRRGCASPSGRRATRTAHTPTPRHPRGTRSAAPGTGSSPPRGTATCTATRARPPDRSRGCTRSSRSTGSRGAAAARCAPRARRRAPRTSPTAGRSRGRCRGRTCRGGTRRRRSDGARSPP